MQITITLNSAEELSTFLKNMTLDKESEQKPVKAEQKPAEASAPEPAQMPEPTPTPTAPAVTRQAVQAKAIALMDAKKQDALQALLKKYGVPALPSIPEDQLEAFMADLEAI